MSYKTPEATFSTLGRAAPGNNAAPFKWRGHEDWYPGNLKYRDGGKPPKTETSPSGPGGKASTRYKRERLARFEVILTELCRGDLEGASDEQIRRAGVCAGVGERTARQYWKELLRQGAES